MEKQLEKIKTEINKVKDPKELMKLFHEVKKEFANALAEHQSQHENLANEIQQTIDKINGNG